MSDSCLQTLKASNCPFYIHSYINIKHAPWGYHDVGKSVSTCISIDRHINKIITPTHYVHMYIHITIYLSYDGTCITFDGYDSNLINANDSQLCYIDIVSLFSLLTDGV